MECVLRADRVLVDGQLRPAAVGISAGRIAFIGSADADCPAAQEVRIPEAAVLLPGFVDTHVHINEPGSDWEGFDTATAAAAAGGITTLVDMPLDSDPVTISVPAVIAKAAAAEGNCHVDVGYWAVSCRITWINWPRWPQRVCAASNASSPIRAIRTFRI